jgi:hypothetical protein
LLNQEEGFDDDDYQQPPSPTPTSKPEKRCKAKGPSRQCDVNKGISKFATRIAEIEEKLSAEDGWWPTQSKCGSLKKAVDMLKRRNDSETDGTAQSVLCLEQLEALVQKYPYKIKPKGLPPGHRPPFGNWVQQPWEKGQGN